MNSRNCDVAAASVAIESTPDRPSGKPVNICTVIEQSCFLLIASLSNQYESHLHSVYPKEAIVSLWHGVDLHTMEDALLLVLCEL